MLRREKKVGNNFNLDFNRRQCGETGAGEAGGAPPSRSTTTYLTFIQTIGRTADDQHYLITNLGCDMNLDLALFAVMARLDS